ncbi:MAG: hypothetical protein AAF564_26620 [Bacteroidota bacterium]
MKERPVLFSAPMVNAILEERKTQTRRVVKSIKSAEGLAINPNEAKLFASEHMDSLELQGFDFRSTLLTSVFHCIPPMDRCPYGQPGDLLWVRETWANMAYECNPPEITYRANSPSTDVEGWALPPGVVWRPSIHMPRWASRITLIITDVRVERLQSISDDDAKAEGLMWSDFGLNRFKQQLPGWHWKEGADWKQSHLFPRHAFYNLWNSINEKTHPWESNPWVWVVEFERVC